MTFLFSITPLQRSFNEMQTWITELRQLGPQNLVLAITGNKLDLESARQVRLASVERETERERERERERHRGGGGGGGRDCCP